MKTGSLLCTLVLVFVGVGYSQEKGNPASDNVGMWVDISAEVIRSLESEGKKIGYPGKTAGITVDRMTGDVFMVIPDQGIWRSSDQGGSFTRIDA